MDNALEFGAQGDPVTAQEEADPTYIFTRGSRPSRKLWSNKYQWLPSNVSISEDGWPRLTSYINNLHPHTYPDAYTTIEKLIDRAIPAWDQCLRRYFGPGKNLVAGRTGRRFEWYETAE